MAVPIWQVYSVNGRLLWEGTDEATARRGVLEWLHAWTLVCDGRAVDINPRPNRKDGE